MEFKDLPKEYIPAVIAFFRKRAAQDNERDKLAKISKRDKFALKERKGGVTQMLEILKLEAAYLAKKKKLYDDIIKSKEDKGEASGQESGDEVD